MYETKQNTSYIPFFDYSPVRHQRTVLFFYEEPTASLHLCFWRYNPINVHVWNAPISNRRRLLYVRVFSPAAAILENKKILKMRLTWARKVDIRLFLAKFGLISPHKTIIAFLQCIAYMKIQFLSQQSQCATDTLPVLDRQFWHIADTVPKLSLPTVDWWMTDDQLIFNWYSTDNCPYRTNTSPTL